MAWKRKLTIVITNFTLLLMMGILESITVIYFMQTLNSTQSLKCSLLTIIRGELNCYYIFPVTMY